MNALASPQTIATDGRSSALSAASQPITASEQMRRVIERTVANVFGIDCEDLRRPTRGQAQVALARQVAMYITHVVCGVSLTEVGAMFLRDRTTVSHACEVVEKRRDNGDFDHAIELIELVIRVLMGPGAGGGAAAVRREAD